MDILVRCLSSYKESIYEAVCPLSGFTRWLFSPSKVHGFVQRRGYEAQSSL
jgi:hypothetical protein